jgi:hypothetical protein
MEINIEFNRSRDERMQTQNRGSLIAHIFSVINGIHSITAAAK